MALWLEDVLKNAEIAAKFFLSDGCLRIWADGSFEAVHWKSEAMFWEGVLIVTDTYSIKERSARSETGNERVNVHKDDLQRFAEKNLLYKLRSIYFAQLKVFMRVFLLEKGKNTRTRERERERKIID